MAKRNARCSWLSPSTSISAERHRDSHREVCATIRACLGLSSTCFRCRETSSNGVELSRELKTEMSRCKWHSVPTSTCASQCSVRVPSFDSSLRQLPSCELINWLVTPNTTTVLRPGARTANGNRLGRAELVRTFHAGASNDTPPSVTSIELSKRTTEL